MCGSRWQLVRRCALPRLAGAHCKAATCSSYSQMYVACGAPAQFTQKAALPRRRQLAHAQAVAVLPHAAALALRQHGAHWAQ